MRNEAKSAAKISIWNQVYSCVFCANLLLFLGMQMVNTLVAKYADALGAAPTIVGVVSSLFALTALIFKIVSGPAIDAFNRKYILMAAIAVIAFSFLGFSLSNNVEMLFAFRLIQGCGQAFTATCCLALAADSLPADKFGIGIGTFTLAQAACQAIGPSLGLALADHVGYRVAFAVAAGCTLCAVLAAACIKTPVRQRKKFRISADSILAREALFPAVLLFLLQMTFCNINSFLVIFAEQRGVSNIGFFFTVYAVSMQNIIAIVETSWQSGDWSPVSRKIISIVSLLAVFYILALLSGFAFNQMMAIITQGSLKKLREKMFNGMQDLPIKYFDMNNHGDIMSHYTNDIDTLRQMVSQSFPQLLVSAVTVLTLFWIMVYYCVWLTLVVLLGVTGMLIVTKKVGGNSAKHFFQQQNVMGKEEGFIEEIMNGQKVVKVFCHEEESKADFDRINDTLFSESERANRYANILGPILNNIGNVLYVVVALTGGVLLALDVPNISISGLAFSISVVVPFLNMTKQFAGNVNQVSHQVNAVVMGLAETQRIFALLDEQPESDGGYVTLVNVSERA